MAPPLRFERQAEVRRLAQAGEVSVSAAPMEADTEGDRPGFVRSTARGTGRLLNEKGYPQKYGSPLGLSFKPTPIRAEAKWKCGLQDILKPHLVRFRA